MTRISAHVGGSVRRLTATPVFAGAATATLALAVAGVTAAFAVADKVLLDPLPFPDGNRLVDVGYAVPGYGFDRLPFSVGAFVHTRGEQRFLSDFAIYYDSDRFNVGLDDPERVPVARVTAGFFEVFRSPPDQGRTFNESDEAVGADPVVIVSHDLWARRWGADPGLVGRTVHVDGVDRRVVGIAREGFRFPDRRTGMWIPFTIDPAELRPVSFGYPGVGRLATNVSLEAARQEMARITGQLSDVYPDRLTPRWAADGRFHSYVRPLSEGLVGDVSREVWLVFGTSALLFLLAGANLANLFLVRVEGRARERAIRRALGSGRLEMLALPLAEGVVLGIVGGLVGVAAAYGLLAVVVGVAPPDLPRADEIRMDVGVAAFGVVMSILAGAAFALLPAVAGGGGNPQDGLRSGGSGAGASRGARRLQYALVANQAALALALVVGAGLVARSARNLATTDPGFRAEAVLTFEIGLPAGEYDAAARARTFQEIADRVAEIASVTAVGGGEFLPLTADFRKGPLHVEGEDLPDGQSGPVVDLNRVTPGFLAALGIPMLGGRDLEPGDGPEGYAAVVANQVLVDRHLGGIGALGRNVRITTRGTYAEIVGVAGSARTKGLRDEPIPFLYYPPGATTPSAPEVPAAMTFAVRSEDPIERLVPALAEAVGRIDPKLPLGSVRTMESVVKEHLARHTLVTWVLLLMAATGLLLAAVGVYGVVAYVVARGRREIGVRIALGAGPGTLLGRVVGGTLGVVAVGAAAGAGLALLADRFVESLLFGVSGADPLTYAGAFVLVLGVAGIASFSPAWRASRLDASLVLREE